MNDTRQHKDSMPWLNWSDARLLAHLIDGATADTPVKMISRRDEVELAITVNGNSRRVAGLRDGEGAWHAREPGYTERTMSEPGCEAALLQIVMRAGGTLGQDAINTIASLERP